MFWISEIVANLWLDIIKFHSNVMNLSFYVWNVCIQSNLDIDTHLKF